MLHCPRCGWEPPFDIDDADDWQTMLGVHDLHKHAADDLVSPGFSRGEQVKEAAHATTITDKSTERRAHWRCTCGVWETVRSRTGAAIVIAGFSATVHRKTATARDARGTS